MGSPGTNVAFGSQSFVFFGDLHMFLSYKSQINLFFGVILIVRSCLFLLFHRSYFSCFFAGCFDVIDVIREYP